MKSLPLLIIPSIQDAYFQHSVKVPKVVKFYIRLEHRQSQRRWDLERLNGLLKKITGFSSSIHCTAY